MTAQTQDPQDQTPQAPGSPEAGVVLLIVLVLIVLTYGPVVAFGRSSLLEVMSARQRMDRVRAELLARSGLSLGLRALTDDLVNSDDPLGRNLDTSRDPWFLLSEAPIEFPDGELRIEIEDSGTRLSLNALVAQDGTPIPESREFLRDALERIIDNMPGRREEKLYDIEDIADGILDWIDPDEETRLGDTEADYYRDRGAERPPPNRPLFSLAELATVPGVDDRLLQALGAYFAPAPGAPRSGGAGLNPNTAPPHVLALLYLKVGDRGGRFIEDEDVYRVLKARKDGQIFCPSSGEAEACVELTSVLGRGGETIFPPVAYRSNIFTVRVRAQVLEAEACVVAVIDRSDPASIAPIAYRLGC